MMQKLERKIILPHDRHVYAHATDLYLDRFVEDYKIRFYIYTALIFLDARTLLGGGCLKMLSCSG